MNFVTKLHHFVCINLPQALNLYHNLYLIVGTIKCDRHIGQLAFLKTTKYNKVTIYLSFVEFY